MQSKGECYAILHDSYENEISENILFSDVFPLTNLVKVDVVLLKIFITCICAKTSNKLENDEYPYNPNLSPLTKKVSSIFRPAVPKRFQ